MGSLGWLRVEYAFEKPSKKLLTVASWLGLAAWQRFAISRGHQNADVLA
jgi:hypothetical protein